MNDIIYVTGNILAKSGHHVAKNWLSLAGDDYKNEAIQIIEGDLVLTSEYNTTPYCVYATRGGVTCTYGNIEWLGDADLLLRRYQHNIDKLRRLVDMNVPEDLMEDQLKCLYAGVFAEFESFMIELLSFLILSNKSNYEDYIDRNNINRNGDTFKDVYKSIHNINGHKIRALREEYEALGIIIPDATVIGRHIDFRHDVIHRSGKKVMGNHLKPMAFSKEILFKLIDDCNTYIMSLVSVVQNVNNH